MGFGLRLGMPLLAAALLACSAALQAAEGDEDYALGYQKYTEGDIVGAMTPLRKGALAGHVRSMVLLAQILDISEFNDEAIELFRKAAEQGDAEGMFGLGVMIAAGEGVKTKDPVEGMRWIRKAAELGVPRAINVVAQAYLRAELGIGEAERNTPEALRWSQLAAKNDYLPAIDALIEAYSRGGGLLGIATPDPAMADAYVVQANKVRNIDPSKMKKKKGRKADAQPANAPQATN